MDDSFYSLFEDGIPSFMINEKNKTIFQEFKPKCEHKIGDLNYLYYIVAATGITYQGSIFGGPRYDSPVNYFHYKRGPVDDYDELYVLHIANNETKRENVQTVLKYLHTSEEFGLTSINQKFKIVKLNCE